MRRGMLIAGVALLALAACNKGGEPSPDATATGANAADLTPEGPGLTAKLFGGGKPMPLDVQRQAANGTILYITSVQAKPTETVLGVKVVNGSERDIELEWTDQKTFLVAGGQKFFVSPPLENKDLKVTKGATMQGELVFLGRVPKGSTLTLVINDGQSDSQYGNSPGLSIPLPVADTAWNDDGSKKNSAA